MSSRATLPCRLSSFSGMPSSPASVATFDGIWSLPSMCSHSSGMPLSGVSSTMPELLRSNFNTPFSPGFNVYLAIFPSALSFSIAALHSSALILFASSTADIPGAHRTKHRIAHITARNLLSRPPHRKRSEPGRASGNEGVWGERGAEEGRSAVVTLLRTGDFVGQDVVAAEFMRSGVVREHGDPLRCAQRQLDIAVGLG